MSSTGMIGMNIYAGAFAKVPKNLVEIAKDTDEKFTEARKHYDFVRQNVPPNLGTAGVDMEWTIFGSKRYGKDPDGLFALAVECENYFADLRRETEDRLKRERDQRIHAESTGVHGTNISFQSRSTFANAACRDLWNLGSFLKCVAAEIEDTLPKAAFAGTPATATAPIGTDAELTAFLDNIEPRLTKLLSEKVRALRVAISARAKSA